MFGFKKYWICKIFGHRFQKVKDLRISSLQRERVIYRCQRCRQSLVIREKERRALERRRTERRQNNFFDRHPRLKYTA